MTTPALTLDPRAGVTTGAAVPYGAAAFASASNQYVTAADQAAFRITGSSFYVAVWVKFATVAANQSLVGKAALASNATVDWDLHFTNGLGITFLVSNGTTLFFGWAPSPSAGTLYFVEGWYDGTNTHTQINRGTVFTSATFTGTPNVTANPLAVGFTQGFSPFNGSLSSLVVLQTVPGTADRDWLYNAGAGRTYADVVAGGKTAFQPAAGAGEWWDLHGPHVSHVGAKNGVVLSMPRSNYSNQPTTAANAPTFGPAILPQPASALVKVAGVADQSGSGHDATVTGGAEPILDPNAFGTGLPGFRFDGYAARLTVNAALAKERGFALQALIKLNGSQVDSMRLARVHGTKADGAGDAQFAVGLGRTANTTWAGNSPGFGFSGTGLLQYGPSAGAFLSDLAAPAVLTVRYAPADTSTASAPYQAWLNNTPLTIGAGVNALGSAPVTASDFGWNGTGNFLDGVVGPLKVWDLAPPVGDLMQSALDLAAAYKVNITTPLLQNAYPNAQVVAIGNSMTDGIGTINAAVTQRDTKTYPSSYPMQLLALLGSAWDVINLGKGGQTSEGIVTDPTALPLALTLYRPSAPANIAVVWEFVNSLYTNGDTPDQAYGYLTTTVQKLKQNGYKVVLVSCPSYALGSPLTPVAGWAAKQAACDALVAANTAGADTFIYPSQIPQLADPTNGTYVADGLHYNVTGYQIFAQHVQAAVAALAPPAGGSGARSGQRRRSR